MSKKPSSKDLDPTVVSEVFTRRVAVLAMSGKSSAQIAEDMGVSVALVKTIQRAEPYKKLVERIGEQEMMFAVSRGKTRLAGMVDTAADVVHKVMRDYLDGKTNSARDAIVAAQTVNRSVGVDKMDDKPGDASITVNFGGIVEPMTIEAEVVKEDT